MDPFFDVTFYDATELAEIEPAVYDEKELHEQFITRGIDRAVQKLIELEKSPITILAFSIGGVIAWKYGLQTLHVNSMYCVSSTRLRKETVKPNTKTYMYYGDMDVNMQIQCGLLK